MPGFEQDPFAAASQANERPLRDIMAEYVAVREATIALFRGLPEEALVRSGVGDGRHSTVRALAYHLAGHEAHHVGTKRNIRPIYGKWLNSTMRMRQQPMAR